MCSGKYEQGLKENNRPTPILGSDESYSPCFTTDFVRINNNKELFCYGCGDGGTRVYNFNIKT